MKICTKRLELTSFLSGHFHLADDSFAARYRTRILNQLQWQEILATRSRQRNAFALQSYQVRMGSLLPSKLHAPSSENDARLIWRYIHKFVLHCTGSCHYSMWIFKHVLLQCSPTLWLTTFRWTWSCLILWLTVTHYAPAYVKQF